MVAGAALRGGALATTAPLCQSLSCERAKPLAHRGDRALDGVATLASGAALGSSGLDALDLRDQLDDSDRWARVSADLSNVVVELRRAGQSVTYARLDELRLRWGAGEMAYIQDVPVGLVLSPDSCAVSR